LEYKTFHLKGTTNEFRTKINNKNSIDLQRAYMLSRMFSILEPLFKVNLVKDVNDNLPVESHSDLTGWKEHFCRLLQVDRSIIVKQAGIHTAEPVVTEPSTFDTGMAIEKTKICKSLGFDQIPSQVIQAGGRSTASDLHTRINSMGNNGQLPHH